MYCKKCGRHPHEDGYVDLEMYEMPVIRFRGEPFGNVVAWEIYCEECVKEYLDEEFRTKEEDE